MIYESPFLIVSPVSCVSIILATIREKVVFSLVCTYKKTINDVEVNVDIQKGP